MTRLLTVTCACLMLAGAATGQVLDLGTGHEPPELGDSTYVAALVAQLEGEITQLGQTERGASDTARSFIRAAINCRILAAELLINGCRGGEASPAVVSGLCLAQGRQQIDDVLRGLVEPAKRLEAGQTDPSSAGQARRALVAVRLFNEKAIDHAESVRTGEGGALDRGLTLIFAPLADAVSAATGAPVGDHWPTGRAVEPRAPQATAGNPVEPGLSVAQLSARLADAALRDDTRRELEKILGFLRRGEAFSEYQPLVRDYREILAATFELAEAMRGADWLNDDHDAAYEDRIHDAIVLFKDPRTREEGRRRLALLASARQVIVGITELAAARIDVRPLLEALLAIDATIGTDDARTRRELALLRRVVDGMLAFRAIDRQGAGLTRDVRRAHQRLVKSYLDAESALLDDITQLAAGGEGRDPLSDPAFSSLLTDQRQYLQDLRRVRAVPEWIDAIRAIEPDAADPFAVQVRKMCTWLLDPTRRPDAIRAMRQFEQQRQLFDPLPFEAVLRASEPEAIMATGSLHKELLQRIVEQRRRWAAGWGEGNASSDAAVQMLQLYRLTRAMEDAAAVVRLGGDADILNRWAAWEVPTGTFERPLTDLPIRLKLATADAVSADVTMLARHLDEIDADAPLARLAGRLTEILEEDLTMLPDGALCTLGQLVHPPTQRSWMLERRRDLAEVCRYAVEQEYARSRGDDDLEERLQAFVGARAQTLLAELGEQPAHLPTLIGFDGSDPDGEG